MKLNAATGRGVGKAVNSAPSAEFDAADSELSTRDTDVRDNGSANLLVWSAMKRAHELGLFFDLDGVSNAGMARFLSGFGGTIKTRLIITKGRPVYNIAQSLKTILRGGRSVQSTFT